jgi:CheY-like chemotaxis protein
MSKSPFNRDRLRWFDSLAVEALPAAEEGSRGRVLIVDDNRDAAKNLSMLLQMEGHDVTVAYDGPSALELARTNLPDVILLDIGLPGLDGLEVARRLREDPSRPDVLLVALTGHAQDEDLCRSREAGFNAHLIKPVKLDTLNKLISGRNLAVHDCPPPQED